jgi:exosome complex component RRP42
MNTLKQHVIRFLDSGIRFDNRKLDEYRPIQVEAGISKNAEGSARVKIGDTELLVGVKLSIDKPYPDIPNEGTIMVGAELLPISSPEFEAGPPDNQSIELARVVDRGIRESKTIDVKKLCITAGEKVWMVAIDICTINDAGNLFDAAALAAAMAIKNTRFPKFEEEKIDYKEHTKEQLPINKLPVSVTVMKIGSHFIIDPSTEEEKAADARLTVASVDGKICALQKGGETPITTADVEKMTELALRKAKELSKYL